MSCKVKENINILYCHSWILEELKTSLNLGNACCHLVQNIPISPLKGS